MPNRFSVFGPFLKLKRINISKKTELNKLIKSQIKIMYATIFKK